ncbi:MAG: ABC transporter ATP-binding protein [Lachnospiraceae bacterium]|nr:ABC transporter ATP-binding protein [Lachnospiraceae bacterium]
MKIVLQDLTKTFPARGKKNAGEVTAVDHFTFEIPDGELIGLLGPSGCGKSTTLNLISGLLKPTGGKIFFGDDDVTDLAPENRGVGLVFQNYALYPHLTVKKNITFPLENLKGDQKLTKAQMEEKALEAAKLVQIENLMDRKPGELSGGQQQRVAIARALVKMPRVLLLDEPLSNLDARLRLQTREEIRRIQRQTGITTVFVTHDQDEAMSICDRIVVMQEGHVQQIGRPQEVYDDPANLFVAKFLGTPPINVFQGKVSHNRIYIGDEAIMEIEGVKDQELTVAVRPEGFVVKDNGPLSCKLDRLEVMGRDLSVISGNPACEAAKVRSIIPAETVVDTLKQEVHFTIKPNKIFLFEKESGKRIPFTLVAGGRQPQMFSLKDDAGVSTKTMVPDEKLKEMVASVLNVSEKEAENA